MFKKEQDYSNLSKGNPHLIFDDSIAKIISLTIKIQSLTKYLHLSFLLDKNKLPLKLTSGRLEALTCNSEPFVIETDECIFNGCRAYFADQHFGNRTIHVYATCPTKIHYKDNCLKCSIEKEEEGECSERLKGNLEGSLILRKLFGH